MATATAATPTTTPNAPPAPPPTETKPSSGLFIPIVVWGQKPPTSRVTAFTILTHSSVLVTGTETGHLFLWKLRVDHVYPHVLFIGHSTPITAISAASTSSASNRFVSASDDGRLCLWDVLDHRCIDSIMGYNIHRKMVPISYKTTLIVQSSRLLCTGDYCDFMVLNSQDLIPVFLVSSRVDPDWISAFSLIERSNHNLQVIAFSSAGMVKLWTFNDMEKKLSLSEAEKKEFMPTIYEDESRRLDIRDIVAVDFSAANEKSFLVVGKNCFHLFDIDDLLPIVSFESASPILWGRVIEIDKIAIAFGDGSVRIFQLPIESLRGSQIISHFGPNRKNYFSMAKPFEVAQLEGRQALSKWMPSVAMHVVAINQPDSTWLIIRATEEGEIMVWIMPRFGSSFIDMVSNIQQLPLRYKGTFSSSLQSVWESLKEQQEDESFPEIDPEITASLYINFQGKLVIGRSNGDIILTYACELISRQLLDASNDRPTTRLLQGHTAAVRSLLHPYEHGSRFNVHTMLSGSDDFSVIVWNINTASKLYQFHVNGGPVTRFLIPPSNSTKQTLQCIAAVSEDNTVALLNIKTNKCILLASRHPHKVLEIKWRPLDDFMLVRLTDHSIYVWQIETGSIDRIIYGLQAQEILQACDEQIGVSEGSDEAGAPPAIQLIRAIKHRNIDAVKKVGTSGNNSSNSTSSTNKDGSTNPTNGDVALAPPPQPAINHPLSVQPLPGCSSGAHVVVFEISSIIRGLNIIDSPDDINPDPKSISQLIKKNEKGTENEEAKANAVAMAQSLARQLENALHLDIVRLMLSCLHAWELDADLDAVCIKRLGLAKPRQPLYYGMLSRQGTLAVLLPSGSKHTYSSYAVDKRWQESHSLTTVHLLSVIACANTLMSMRNTTSNMLCKRRSTMYSLKRSVSKESKDSRDGRDAGSTDHNQMKQGWSLLTALHCVMLPDCIRPKVSYAAPRLELLARRWQDSCLEVREAAQALLIRELNRLGAHGRRRLIESWAPYLPTLIGKTDPNLSIFGVRQTNNPIAPTPMPTASPLPPPPPPPIPPRSHKQPLPSVQEPTHCQESENGIQQMRRNQATAVILLGVVGSEFGDELHKTELTRPTAISLLELLVSAPTKLLPVHSPLRRAAIDLLGRGFIQWEPHLEISKVLLGLLDLASGNDKYTSNATAAAIPPYPPPPIPPIGPGPLPPLIDASRTARHALSLIASARPPAMLTALSMEVARYNAAAQHQTIQHSVISPLLKCRTEVLRIIEELADKQYGSVVEMMLPVGDVLVHCLDTHLLKHKNLAEVFPPITKFFMVAYCYTSRRIAFGGRSGACVIHELRSSKALNVTAHQGPVTAIGFSQDGKLMATYGANEGKIIFWQASQSFLGMGQTTMKAMKSMTAPSFSISLSPGETTYRPRLVWTSNKSVTLMLPEGREQRFSL